jgi:hypothetical protein
VAPLSLLLLLLLLLLSRLLLLLLLLISLPLPCCFCCRCCTDFAPFNINVTTIPPPANASASSYLRVVIGGNSSWYGKQVGSLAHVSCWHSSCQVLPSLLYC